MGRDYGVVALDVLQAFEWSEPRDSAIDEGRVGGLKGFVVCAEAFGGAGHEGVEENVALGGETFEGGLTVGGLEVQEGALLATVPHGRRVVGPGGVATGGFDLDDLGACVGHDHGGKCACPGAAEVQDSETGADFGSHVANDSLEGWELIETVELVGVQVADLVLLFVGAIGEDFGQDLP